MDSVNRWIFGQERLVALDLRRCGVTVTSAVATGLTRHAKVDSFEQIALEWLDESALEQLIRSLNLYLEGLKPSAEQLLVVVPTSDTWTSKVPPDLRGSGIDKDLVIRWAQGALSLPAETYQVEVVTGRDAGAAAGEQVVIAIRKSSLEMAKVIAGYFSLELAVVTSRGCLLADAERMATRRDSPQTTIWLDTTDYPWSAHYIKSGFLSETTLLRSEFKCPFRNVDTSQRDAVADLVIAEIRNLIQRCGGAEQIKILGRIGTQEHDQWLISKVADSLNLKPLQVLSDPDFVGRMVIAAATRGGYAD